MANDRPPGVRTRAWLDLLQQGICAVYLVAGVLLLYWNARSFRLASVKVAGVLFIAYSVCRFFLVRRWIRRR